MDKSLAEAMHIVNQPSQFAQFQGYQELALFIWKVNYFFLPLHLFARQQQTAVNAQMEST